MSYSDWCLMVTVSQICCIQARFNRFVTLVIEKSNARLTVDVVFISLSRDGH